MDRLTRGYLIRTTDIERYRLEPDERWGTSQEMVGLRVDQGRSSVDEDWMKGDTFHDGEGRI